MGDEAIVLNTRKESAMSFNVLVYGATGFSGRLIAAEGKAMGMSKRGARLGCRMILAGRDGSRLRAVAEANYMDYRVFDLESPSAIRKGLDGIDVVVNAAGPFSFTAERLATAALGARCHYLDINGEIDVYLTLERISIEAARRGVAFVMSAGYSATASDLMLRAALQHLQSISNGKDFRELGAVRVAVSQMAYLSKGSVATVLQSLREHVIVVRKSRIRSPAGDVDNSMVLRREPVGKLERIFNFERRQEDGKKVSDAGVYHVASAANLVDTLSLRHTVHREGMLAHAIESYVQIGAGGRVAYQFSGLLAPFVLIPWVRSLIQAQFTLLPEGPTATELERDRHAIVLEIEDVYRTRVINWLLETPNVYQLTAQFVVAIACRISNRVANGQPGGRVSPSDILDLEDIQNDRSLRGCKLERRAA
jgi:short subunit dehydrogenase-like uncharacterized protein